MQTYIGIARWDWRRDQGVEISSELIVRPAHGRRFVRHRSWPPRPTPEELAAQTARQQEELNLKQMREQMGQYRYLGYLSQEGIEKDVRQHRRRSSACDVTLPGVGKGIGHESRFGCKICGDQWGFCCYMRGSCREEVMLAKFPPLVTG